ncbi:hypothetical protein MTO96_051909 [Rhipicephalus appendiculatus]
MRHRGECEHCASVEGRFVGLLRTVLGLHQATRQSQLATRNVWFSLTQIFPRRPLSRANEGYTYSPAVPLTTCVGNPVMVFGQPGPVSIVTVSSSWGPHPVSVSCPYCKTFVKTQVCPQPGLLTWLLSTAMSMLWCVQPTHSMDI